jgi:hypothetical protein
VALTSQSADERLTLVADASRRNTVLLALLLAAGILLLFTPAGADAAKNCGNLPGSGARAAFDIEARGLSCHKAKKVARAFTNKAAIGGPVKRVNAAGRSFRCRTKRIAFETFRTKCTASTAGGPRSSSFTWGF